MSKYNVVVGYQEFRRYKAEFVISAEDLDDAWRQIYKLKDESFDDLDFSEVEHEPDDYQIYEIHEIQRIKE